MYLDKFMDKCISINLLVTSSYYWLLVVTTGLVYSNIIY